MLIAASSEARGWPPHGLPWCLLTSARSISGEGWAAIAGAIGSMFLLFKKLLAPKPSSKPEPVTRSDFFAEMLATRERINATHLALLEKLDANHRELLAALERQSARISGLEAGFARLDERTVKETREQFRHA